MCNYPFKPLNKIGLLGLLFSLSLSACAQATPMVIPSPQPSNTHEVQATSTPAKLVEITSTVPAAVESLPTTPTVIPPTSDRLKPEDWQNWPVIPVVSGRARQIYQTGLATGTNPASFSKVGDCQAIKDVLLGRYDKPGSYTLRENADALTETITYFAGSFDRDGEAVQGGFNAASELTPLMSNPDVCEPGETPLECEVRVHNPSILIISLEVWWNGRSTAVYEKNMRQIIDYSLSKGILPVLSTKADNVEGDNSINLATARLAYDYDLPLWNWWKAAQALPNHGMDPDRPDGFHISQEFAWPERSFTALQALDAVWRGVRSSSTAMVEIPSVPPTAQQAAFDLLQPTVTAAAVSTEIAQSAATEISTPGAEKSLTIPVPGNAGMQVVDPQLLANPGGFILFSTARRSGETVTPLGIFALDPATGASTRLAAEGMTLQAVSPDGRKILISRGSELLLAALDGSQPVVLTDRFFERGSPAAIWMPDGKTVAFLAKQDSSSLLVLYSLDGSAGWTRLSPSGVQPVAIIPSTETGKIFWENGQCPASGTCTRTGIYVSGLDGSSAEILPGAVKAGFSSDKHWLAFEEKTKDEKSKISLATIDLTTKRPLENLGDQFLDFSWSPDGTKLSLLTLERSDYSGKWLDVRNLVITPQNMGTKILPTTSGMNPRAVWSADSSSLLLTGTQESEKGYTIHLNVMDTATGTVRDLTTAAGFTDKEFIYTTQINWVKAAQ